MYYLLGVGEKTMYESFLYLIFIKNNVLWSYLKDGS